MAEPLDEARVAMVLGEVLAERRRQYARFGDQSALPDGTGGEHLEEVEVLAKLCFERANAAGELTFRHMLAEETAEADAQGDPVRLRAELVQVAAVAVQWIEAIDRRAGR